MILLENGTIIDGTGGPSAIGSVLLDGARIAEVGRFAAPADVERIDCAGLAIAPGFIDLHSHSDLQVLERRRAKTDQGVTTEVVGNCGFSAYPCGTHRHAVQEFANGILYGGGRDWGWPDAASYHEAAREEASLVHVTSMVGHGTLRVAFVGPRQGAATAQELDAMQGSLAECLSGGASGFSTGLMYAPGSSAPTEELVALCRVTARYGKTYATHMRSYSDDLLPALDEQIALARAAGCRLEISHLQTVGQRNWARQAAAIEKIEQARHEGIDIAFDSYPYLAGSTVLTQLLPQWALDGGIDAMLARLADAGTRATIREETIRQTPQRWSDIYISAIAGEENAAHVGRHLAEIGEALGLEPVDAAFALLEAAAGQVNMLSFNQSEENLRALLTHPLCTVISDGFFVKGRPHPRLYGTFPYLLGEMVRERGWLTLEEAVHKITAKPAERFGMVGRGLLRSGFLADITVFDPAGVAGRATYEAPETPPTGIVRMYREGVPV